MLSCHSRNFSHTNNVMTFFLPHFSSIGHVDGALYALGAGTLDLEGTKRENCQNRSILEQWMQSYANVLCINSWQVFILLAIGH